MFDATLRRDPAKAYGWHQRVSVESTRRGSIVDSAMKSLRFIRSRQNTTAAWQHGACQSQEDIRTAR